MEKLLADALLGKERPDVFWLALAQNLLEPTDSLEGRLLDL